MTKARSLQAGVARLGHRELEQAAVFLSCQPVGQKALTPELLALLGAGAPDPIELQAGLLGWTETSWFLDEQETAAARGPAAGAEAAAGAGAGGRLPAAWRLGNRPNLRQMHHDACRNRVPPELVEARLLDAVARQRSLTAGAAAAGAAVHNLPARPRDVADDGAFHFVVLGPPAASDPGRPSPAATRFLAHTTAPDRPRVYPNAVLLAVPSRDGLDAARTRVREYLGWEEVRAQLREQPIDPLREQMLAAETAAARGRVPDAVRSAWCVVVTVAESGAPEAFRVVVGAEPLFTAIKAERRSRIQETAINAQTLLPGGPYDLWREDEQARRVSDLTGAFGRDPRLPKMLRNKEILDTVADGVEAGVWVAQVTGPERAALTFWRTAIDGQTLADPGLELLLPAAAALRSLAPDLLRPEALPGLWTAQTITVQQVYDYFAGGREVTVPQEGYEESVAIPACAPAQVDAALLQAVEQGGVWLTSGPASILSEPVPAGVLGPAATLRPPPAPLPVEAIMAATIPEAWQDGAANALAVAAALSHRHGATLPWAAVRAVIDDALRARWVELGAGSAAWPCDLAGAGRVLLTLPAVKPPDGGGGRGPDRGRAGVLTAQAVLEANGIQDLADQIPAITAAAVGHELTFNLRIELGGAEPPDAAAAAKINELLAEVADGLRLG